VYSIVELDLIDDRKSPVALGVAINNLMDSMAVFNYFNSENVRGDFRKILNESTGVN
jgi:hypothetical protein